MTTAWWDVFACGNEDLGKIFLEGSEHGVGDLMKGIWYKDSKHQLQQFLQDQFTMQLKSNLIPARMLQV